MSKQSTRIYVAVVQEGGPSQAPLCGQAHLLLLRSDGPGTRVVIRV